MKITKGDQLVHLSCYNGRRLELERVGLIQDISNRTNGNWPCQVTTVQAPDLTFQLKQYTDVPDRVITGRIQSGGQILEEQSFDKIVLKRVAAQPFSKRPIGSLISPITIEKQEGESHLSYRGKSYLSFRETYLLKISEREVHDLLTGDRIGINPMQMTCENKGRITVIGTSRPDGSETIPIQNPKRIEKGTRSQYPRCPVSFHSSICMARGRSETQAGDGRFYLSTLGDFLCNVGNHMFYDYGRGQIRTRISGELLIPLSVQFFFDGMFGTSCCLM